MSEKNSFEFQNSEIKKAYLDISIYIKEIVRDCIKCIDKEHDCLMRFGWFNDRDEPVISKFIKKIVSDAMKEIKNEEMEKEFKYIICDKCRSGFIDGRLQCSTCMSDLNYE